MSGYKRVLAVVRKSHFLSRRNDAICKSAICSSSLGSQLLRGHRVESGLCVFEIKFLRHDGLLRLRVP